MVKYIDSQSRKLTVNIATYTVVFLNVMLVLQSYLQFQKSNIHSYFNDYALKAQTNV